MQKARGKHVRPPLLDEIEHIQKTLYIQDKADWYDVPRTHIKLVAKAGYLLNQYPQRNINIFATCYA